jgi:hypothetical protein
MPIYVRRRTTGWITNLALAAATLVRDPPIRHGVIPYRDALPGTVGFAEIETVPVRVAEEGQPDSRPRIVLDGAPKLDAARF